MHKSFANYKPVSIAHEIRKLQTYSLLHKRFTNYKPFSIAQELRKLYKPFSIAQELRKLQTYLYCTRASKTINLSLLHKRFANYKPISIAKELRKLLGQFVRMQEGLYSRRFVCAFKICKLIITHLLKINQQESFHQVLHLILKLYQNLNLFLLRLILDWSTIILLKFFMQREIVKLVISSTTLVSTWDLSFLFFSKLGLWKSKNHSLRFLLASESLNKYS